LIKSKSSDALAVASHLHLKVGVTFASKYGDTMHVEFVHQMASIKDAYQAVLDVDGEGGELVCGSGIMLLICKGGSSDWYFYVDLNDPSSDDKARILGIMTSCETRILEFVYQEMQSKWPPDWSN
jgi:hypothetical protein